MMSVVKTSFNSIRSAEAHDPSQFYKCQWQRSCGLTRSYVVYRWIIASIFLVVLIAALINTEKSLIEYFKFFIYLTHWGFILCTVQATIGAILVTRKYNELSLIESEAEREERLNQPSNLAEIYWIIYTMSVVSSFGITIIFWTKVYMPEYHEWGVMIFLLHGLNTLLMFIDVIVVAHPLKFLHFLWTFGFVLIYLFFSYVYYLAGGTNSKNHPFIYHSLNWENPENSLHFCISSLIFGFIIHTCMWLLSAVVRKLSGAADVSSSISRRPNGVGEGQCYSNDSCVTVVTFNKN